MAQKRRWAAETLGTFALVTSGTTAIVVDAATQGSVTHVGVALTFGLIVTAMIYALGDVSGAHLNPAVTLGFWAAGRFPARDIPGYIVSQCTGALLASVVVRGLFLSAPDLGATRPAAGAEQSFGLEVLLTALLMFVILGVSTGAKEKGIVAGIAIGATVALGALVGGPISGASMNPARSLGPALVAGDMTHLWLYLTAPCLGAGVAVLACKCVHSSGCCEHDGR